MAADSNIDTTQAVAAAQTAPKKSVLQTLYNPPKGAGPVNSGIKTPKKKALRNI